MTTEFEYRTFAGQGINLLATTPLVVYGEEKESRDALGAPPFDQMKVLEAVEAYFGGELNTVGYKVSADFGPVLMGALPFPILKSVTFNLYDGATYTDSEGLEIAIMIGSHEENPDVALVKIGPFQQLKEGVEEFEKLKAEYHELEGQSPFCFDGIAIHKDSLGAYRETVLKAIEEFNAL